MRSTTLGLLVTTSLIVVGCQAVPQFVTPVAYQRATPPPAQAQPARKPVKQAAGPRTKKVAKATPKKKQKTEQTAATTRPPPPLPVIPTRNIEVVTDGGGGGGGDGGGGGAW